MQVVRAAQALTSVVWSVWLHLVIPTNVKPVQAASVLAPAIPANVKPAMAAATVLAPAIRANVKFAQVAPVLAPAIPANVKPAMAAATVLAPAIRANVKPAKMARALLFVHRIRLAQMVNVPEAAAVVSSRAHRS